MCNVDQRGTPANEWVASGRLDPYQAEYDKDCLDIYMGHLTDIQVLEKLNDLIGMPFKRGLYIKCAYERIMFLSRKLSSLETSDNQRFKHNEERSKLPMGTKTDDVMARDVSLYGHSVNSGNYYISAASARIEWLSNKIKRIV